MDKLSGQTMDIVQHNIDSLKQLFPEVVTEGKIDFEKLKILLGDNIESNNAKYEFTWNGKENAIKLAQTPSLGTLLPDNESSKNWDSTENIFIEGDNLEVLKLLQKSYFGKIKMIYIDPPYNTGKDFVYKDKYHNSIQNYKEQTAQLTKANTETSGRYHTDWLNMMYPRLKLARNLMKDDGIIFISIDDNEDHNLRKLCDEVLGEDNFIARIIHKNNSNKNQAKLMGVTTEYIFCYAKNIASLKDSEWRVEKKGAGDVHNAFEKLKNQGLSISEISEEIKDMYRRPKYAHLSRWNKVDEKGVFKDADLSREGGSKEYTIINPNNGEPCVIPKRGWGKSYEELLRLQKEGLIWYGDSRTPPGLKDYLSAGDLSVPDNFWYFDNSVDTRFLRELFGRLVFENPKPIEMIKQIIKMSTNEKDIILDFFGGSGTTGQAVIEVNKENNGKLTFIVIQIPELTDQKSEAYKAGYYNICEIGKERIGRAGDIIRKNSSENDLDIGFKVFKLAESNIKQWNNEETIEDLLSSLECNIVTGRTNEALLFEILLKIGLPLTTPIETIDVNGKTIYDVAFGSVLLCLDDDITLDIVNEMLNHLSEDIEPKVIFKEIGFRDDTTKTNAIQTLKKYGLKEENIRSV
jgi:adenine-specific DNA-methyltransferase